MAGLAALAGGRAHDNDLAAVSDPPGRLSRREENGRQIRLQRSHPLLIRHARQLNVVGWPDPGIGHEDVECVELRVAALEQFGDALRLAQIGRRGPAPHPEPL